MASAKFLKVLFSWATKPEDCICVLTPEASMANSVDRDQTAPFGAVCSWSTLFASMLNSSVMLGNYLQQTT